MDTYNVSVDLSSILKKIDERETRRIEKEIEIISDLYDSQMAIHHIMDNNQRKRNRKSR